MSNVIKVTPKTAPRCPNHGEPLEGCGFPLPAKGQGRCPVSRCMFAFEVDGTEENMKAVTDHNGNVTYQPSWKVIGDDK